MSLTKYNKYVFHETVNILALVKIKSTHFTSHIEIIGLEFLVNLEKLLKHTETKIMQKLRVPV